MCRDYYTLQFMDPSVDTRPIAPALRAFFDDVLESSVSEVGCWRRDRGLLGLTGAAFSARNRLFSLWLCWRVCAWLLRRFSPPRPRRTAARSNPNFSPSAQLQGHCGRPGGGPFQVPLQVRVGVCCLFVFVCVCVCVCMSVCR